MRFAEVILRLGTALVAWMLLYTHSVWLASLRVIGCGPEADSLHQLLLGFSVFTAGAAFAIHLSRPMADVHTTLRWLAIPLALLSPWMLLSIWDVFATVNLGPSSICADAPPAAWHSAWAPIQMALFLAVAVSMLRLIRHAAQQD